MKSLNLDKQKNIETHLEDLNNEINLINNSNLNIEIFRDVLSAAYKVFFSHCSDEVIRFPRITDSNISSILFNSELDAQTVGILNDEMANALVDLLEKYDYEELLKYPVIFTAENYSDSMVN